MHKQTDSDPEQYPITITLNDDGLDMLTMLIEGCTCPACDYLRQCVLIMQSDGQPKH